MSIKRYAVAQGDSVVNVIMADPDEYPQPEGQELILSEGSGPEIGWVRVGGQWAAPLQEAPTLDTLKAEKQAALSAKYQSRVQSFPWHFGSEYGVLHLQLRDVNDQANWLTLQGKAQMLIAAGQGDAEVLAIRTEENITVPVTANVAAQIMDAMAGFGGNLKVVQWAKKDAINAAQTEQALDNVSITDGWPV